MVQNTPANAGDLRDTISIPGSGKSPGGGHGSQKPDGLHSTGSQIVGHDGSDLAHMHT